MHWIPPWLAVLLPAALPGPAPLPQSPDPPLDSSFDPGEEPTVVLLKAQKVIVRPGKVLEGASVLVEDGVIVEVGEGIAAPEGAQVVEGEVVCAGFLDPWSTLGLTRESEADRRADAATRSVDGFDPFRSAHARDEALRAGVVAVRVQGGEDTTLGGVGALVSTGPGTSFDELVLLADASAGASVGASQRGRAADIVDRIEEVDKIVSAVQSGEEYALDLAEYQRELAAWEAEIAKALEKLEKDFKKAKKDREKEVEEAQEKGKEHKDEKYKEDKKPKPPKYDADKEVMARVANGEIPLVVHANRAGELRELLAATRRFGRLRVVVAGGAESLAVADELAERRIPVIVWPAPLGTGRPDELEGLDLTLAGRLAEEDVPVLLGSTGDHSRDLPLLAALAIGHGLDREEAFAALTHRAARTFDVADRLGSVEVGRRADLLVLDGEPLLPTTRVRHVLVNGRVVVTPD